MCVFRTRRYSAERKNISQTAQCWLVTFNPPVAPESSPKNVQVGELIHHHTTVSRWSLHPPHTPRTPSPTPLKFFSCNLIRLWKTDPNHKGHWFRMEIFLVLHPGKIKVKIRNLIRCGSGRQSFCEPTPLKCVFPALQTNIPSALTSLDVSYYAKCTFPMLLRITFLSRLPAKSTVERKAPSFTSSSHVIGDWSLPKMCKFPQSIAGRFPQEAEPNICLVKSSQI